MSIDKQTVIIISTISVFTAVGFLGAYFYKNKTKKEVHFEDPPEIIDEELKKEN